MTAADGATQTREALADTASCLGVMRGGSKTFFLAAKLLPRPLRADFAAIYAFCREADDAIDLSYEPHRALVALRQRLAAIGEAARANDGAAKALPGSTDRALARTLRQRQLSLVPLQALLEGFAWDAEGRSYPGLQDTLAYSARAAGSVGVLLAQLMGVRAPWALARAADMGVAMQLTNICRDVGEDARLGRVYLPGRWLAQVGLAPQTLLAAPTHTPALGQVVARLLKLADSLYARAREGFCVLPPGARLAVAAAARLYADIGRTIAARGYDSVNTRAVVGGPRKAWLVLRALVDVPLARLQGPGANRFRLPLQSSAFLLAGAPLQSAPFHAP